MSKQESATIEMPPFEPQQQQQQQPQQTIFQQSSHPAALFFHLLFRTLAIVTYFFASWFFSSNFILASVLIILNLAFDFWTVKNVTGRLLVGLRWWNDIKEDGTNIWIFESKENRQVNNIDSRVFWLSMYITLVIWIAFTIIAIIGFKFTWAVLCIIAIFMNAANVIGYTRCERDAKQKVSAYLAQNPTVQGWVGNMVSSQLGSMFTAKPVPNGHV